MEQEKKDNVYAKNLGAGEERRVEMDDVGEKAVTDVPQNTPTALGKFKDVDALYKAYSSLQAEFTRRSQRLKELEKLTENLEGNERKSSSAQVAEKLRKTAESLKAEERAFDGFVAELENASQPAPISATSKPDGEAEGLSADVVANGNTATENGEKQSTGGELVTESRADAEQDSKTLYERVRNDEGVRLKIIGEYLASVGKGAVPLTKGGAGTLTAPTLKAKTVDEAGSMALLMFQQDGARA